MSDGGRTKHRFGTLSYCAQCAPELLPGSPPGPGTSAARLSLTNTNPFILPVRKGARMIYKYNVLPYTIGKPSLYRS